MSSKTAQGTSCVSHGIHSVKYRWFQNVHPLGSFTGRRRDPQGYSLVAFRPIQSMKIFLAAVFVATLSC